MKCLVLLCSKYHNNTMEQYGKIECDIDNIKLGDGEYFIHSIWRKINDTYDDFYYITNCGGIFGLDKIPRYPRDSHVKLPNDRIDLIKAHIQHINMNSVDYIVFDNKNKLYQYPNLEYAYGNICGIISTYRKQMEQTNVSTLSK